MEAQATAAVAVLDVALDVAAIIFDGFEALVQLVGASIALLVYLYGPANTRLPSHTMGSSSLHCPQEHTTS